MLTETHSLSLLHVLNLGVVFGTDGLTFDESLSLAEDFLSEFDVFLLADGEAIFEGEDDGQVLVLLMQGGCLFVDCSFSLVLLINLVAVQTHLNQLVAQLLTDCLQSVTAGSHILFWAYLFIFHQFINKAFTSLAN